MHWMSWDSKICQLTQLTWKITETKSDLSEITTGYQKNDFTGFVPVFWPITEKHWYSLKKNHNRIKVTLKFWINLKI